MKMISRPPAFTYKKDRLQADRVPIPFLAEKYGTPLYVYSGSTIRERYRIFAAAFRRVPHTVCYSVKANSNLTILKWLAKFGSGFDVVSGGELERVMHADKKAARKVVFSGVGKTAAELDLGLNADILLFNVEGEGELDLLAERAARARRKARIALRVNPDVSAETHPYISTGLREHKFGVAMQDVADLYNRAARQKYLDVAGVSVHIGSQITSVEPFHAAMTRVAELVRALKANGHDIRFVDAGGGLGIAYKSDDQEMDFETRARNYAQALTSALQGVNIHLLLEPGRTIVAPAGVLVTRVLYVKQNGKKRFLVVDAAMNDLIRPSLYSAYHEVVPVDCSGAELNGMSGPPVYDVVGPICETGDFFARDREVPCARAGDLVAILDAGAYGMTLASNYNTRPRPAEVLVDGTAVKLVRKRETVKDLLRPEL